MELISKRNSMTHTNEIHNYKDPIRIPNGITNIERNDTFKSSHKHPKANMRCIIPKGPCPRINHKRKHPKIILHSNIYPINEKHTLFLNTGQIIEMQSAAFNDVNKTALFPKSSNLNRNHYSVCQYTINAIMWSSGCN